MVQLGEELAFAGESGVLGLIHAGRGDDLERDRAARDDVVGLVDDANPAASDLAVNSEASGDKILKCGVHQRRSMTKARRAGRSIRRAYAVARPGSIEDAWWDESVTRVVA